MFFVRKCLFNLRNRQMCKPVDFFHHIFIHWHAGIIDRQHQNIIFFCNPYPDIAALIDFTESIFYCIFNYIKYCLCSPFFIVFYFYFIFCVRLCPLFIDITRFYIAYQKLPFTFTSLWILCFPVLEELVFLPCAITVL